MEDLRYPIGEFETSGPLTDSQRSKSVDWIEATPELMRGAVEGLSEVQLDLFRRLSEEQWSRRFRHPDLGLMRVDELAAYYDWHGRHHVAHIASLRTRRSW